MASGKNGGGNGCGLCGSTCPSLLAGILGTSPIGGSTIGRADQVVAWNAAPGKGGAEGGPCNIALHHTPNNYV